MLSKAPVDERTNERCCLARIADLYRRIDLGEPRHYAVMDVVMHEQPTQCRTALARRPHGRESDGSDCQMQIGRRRDNGGVVAAELKDRTGRNAPRASVS